MSDWNEAIQKMLVSHEPASGETQTPLRSTADTQATVAVPDHIPDTSKMVPAAMPSESEALRDELARLEAAAPLSARETARYLEIERRLLSLEAAAIRAQGE